MSQEVSHLDSFFHMLHGEIQKVKYDLTSYKRSADKSEKLSEDFNGYFSSLVSPQLVKEESCSFSFQL